MGTLTIIMCIGPSNYSIGFVRPPTRASKQSALMTYPQLHTLYSQSPALLPQRRATFPPAACEQAKDKLPRLPRRAAVPDWEKRIGELEMVSSKGTVALPTGLEGRRA